MTSLAQGLLYLLKAEPTLLPAAPGGASSEHIEHRRRDEVHECKRCGHRAHVAYIAATEIGPRWLDLCAPCDHWLRSDLGSIPDVR